VRITLDGMDDERHRGIVWRSMAAFQRLLGLHARGAALLERPDFVASSVPGAGSLMNAAVATGGAKLAPHLDQIAEFYAGTPKWGAWVDPAATEDVGAAQQRGLVLDSNPVLMAADLADLDPPRAALQIERPAIRAVGAVNDAAYGSTTPHLANSLAELPPDVARPYATRVDGTVASVLLIQDVDTDAFVTMVATLPDQRGKRLASNLLTHALHHARERGQQTTSLQASKLGQGIYARLGYRPLGEVHLYEKRPA
jgi:ribosomal protein S18 acetylase RimI-like enzyme